VWAFIVAVRNVTNVQFYINGNLDSGFNNRVDSNPFKNGIDEVRIGAETTPATPRWLDGKIDEACISTVARSSGWIKTTYNNQYAPNTFYSVGNEETNVITHTYSIALQKFWNLVSLPFNESKTKTSIHVRNNSIEYSWSEAVSHGIILDYVYAWNTTTGNYMIGDSLQPERGYWIWAFYDCELQFSSAAKETNSLATLQPGWNIMGLSCNTTLNKSAVIVCYNNVNYTWTQASTGSDPIILGFIYGWSKNDQMYTLSNTFEPGSSYWMYAYKNCLLKKGG
jgi:hypothetical protein